MRPFEGDLACEQWLTEGLQALHQQADGHAVVLLTRLLNHCPDQRLALVEALLPTIPTRSTEALLRWSSLVEALQRRLPESPSGWLLGVVFQYARGDQQGARLRLQTRLTQPATTWPMWATCIQWWQAAGHAKKVAFYTAQAFSCHGHEPELHFLFADQHIALQQWEEAAQILEQALGLDAQQTQGWYTLGKVRVQLQDRAAALRAFNQVLRRDGNHTGACSRSGLLRCQHGEYTAGLEQLRQAVDQQPELGRLWFRYGCGLLWAGEARAGVDALQHAVQLLPGLAEGWSNLGLAWLQLEQLGRAEEAFQQAITLDPNQKEADLNLALLMLRVGQFEQGWSLYDQRWSWSGMFQPPAEGSLWRPPHPLPEHLWIVAEQGYGDTIQFSRYLLVLADAFQRLTLLVHPALLTLFKRSFPQLDIQALGHTKVPKHAHWTTPIELCRGLDPNLRHPPNPPYLEPSLLDNAQWQARLHMAGSDQRLRIGLVWAGNPKQSNDRSRSMSAGAFQPLVEEVSDALFFSFQVGSQQLHSTDELSHLGVVDLAPLLDDFDQTASALSCMDLLIGVDTAVVHLAGALGMPVWLLLSVDADWRWFHGKHRQSSVFYPSMRLFRQTHARDWSTPMDQMQRALLAPSREIKP
ncbi:tetratricopeptide repeat-containing glycosyltransferase family protein [Magnetococcus sp. PR-3]|uniref:tetratricopeptide repeat-containing glycosyltransferase family protein n=1 Tax=Magnetococcus sp. PR-3 TaxID=3120355 RepID=UPI002FCE4063